MSRSKNRKIADLISGGTFDDGVVAASEVTGLATVATSGSFSDLSNQPTPFDPSTLGTASTQATGAFATAAQGTTADAALPKAGGAVTGNVTFGDNDKAIFGAGSDLQIHHDGANSFVTNSFGDLAIQASTGRISLAKSPFEFMVEANIDADVSLYYDSSKKLATTSTGVDVTGTVNADALTGVGSIDATTAAAITAAGVGGGFISVYTSTTLPTATASDNGRLVWVKDSADEKELRVGVTLLIPTGERTLKTGNLWNQTYFNNTGFAVTDDLTTRWGVEMSTSGNGRSTDGKLKKISGYFNRGMNGTSALTDVSTGNATYTLPANGSWVDLGNYSGSQFVGKTDGSTFIKEVVTTAFYEHSWFAIRRRGNA